MKSAKTSYLYYEPFMVSRYDCAEAWTGIVAHRHSKLEPCHFTIVASGQVAVTVYDDNKNVIGYERYTAPAIIDYNDGKDVHHSIEATLPGTTFFNVPRSFSKKEEVAEGLFS